MADVYVDLGASAAGSGTLASPFNRSQFGTAQTTVGFGDTVYFRECDVSVGDTSTVFNITRDGKSGGVITFKPYNNETVIVRQGKTSDPHYTPVVGIYASYVTLEDIEIRGGSGPAITIYSPEWQSGVRKTDITIKDCLLTDSNDRAIHCRYVDNVLVQGNDIFRFRCKHPYIYGTSDHGATCAFNNVSGLEIKNNKIGDSYGEGIIVDGVHKSSTSSYDISIHDNEVYNCANNLIYIHGVEDYGYTDYIYDNVLYFTPQAYYYKYWEEAGAIKRYPDWRAEGMVFYTSEVYGGHNDAPIDSWEVYNNLIVNCSIGLKVRQGRESSEPIQDNNFYNNTLINNNVGINMAGSREWVNPGTNNFKNNTVVAGSGQVVAESAFPSSLSLTCDYNSWYGDTAPSWATGANDVTSDPTLVDEDADISYGAIDPANYVPDTGSPLINAGMDSGKTTDYFGNTRSASNYDIGFAEAAGATDDLVPAFTSSPDLTSTTVTKGDTVTYSDDTTELGSATVGDQLWIFPGGVPSNAIVAPDGTMTATMDASPTVVYPTPGSFPVYYTVSDATYVPGGRSTFEENHVVVTTEGGDNSFVPVIKQFNVGDTTITHSAGVVPQWALFVVPGATAVDTIVDTLRLSVSVNDMAPISSHAAGVTMNDGTSAVEGFRRYLAKAVGLFTNSASTATEKCSAVVTAVSSTTMTLSWSGDTSDSEIGYVILGGGAAVTDAQAFEITSLTSIGATAQVSGSFDVAIILSSLSSGTSSPVLTGGFAVNGGNQVCVGFSEDNGDPAGNPRSIIRDDSVAAQPKTGARITAAFTSTYVEFTLRDALLISNPALARLHGLAFTLSGVDAACGVADAPSTNSTAVDYSLDHTPGFLMAFLTNMTGVNTRYTDSSAGYLGIYGNDGTTKFTASVMSEDEAATINCGSTISAAWKQYDDDQTELADDDSNGLSFGASKFTINNNPAGGGKFAWLDVEAAASAAGLTALFAIEFAGQAEGRSNPVVGESITLRDLSDGDGTYAITGWDTDWGDGTAHGTTQNPTHTFTAADTYLVTLEVTDANSATDTYTMEISVDPSTGPVWSYSLDVTEGSAPLSVEVDWSATTIANETIDTALSKAGLFRRLTETRMTGRVGYGLTPTIVLDDPGVYCLQLTLVTEEGNWYYKNDSYSPDPSYDDLVTVYVDTDIEIVTSPDYRIGHVGGVEFTFSLDISPADLGGLVDWTYGDGNSDSDELVTAEVTNTYAAVSAATEYTVTAVIDFYLGFSQTVTRKITIVPQRSTPRTEAEFTALAALVKMAIGTIETTDWSKTGGLTYVYEATLNRPWTSATARVTEDGDLLTARTSTALVDANAGSYYCTKSGDNLTIYVHATNSDDPATNGSMYRFLLPTLSIYATDSIGVGESVSAIGPINPGGSDSLTVGEAVSVTIS